MENPAKNSWYTIKSIFLAPLDLRWCKCLEKIFVLAIFSDVMFSISSSNLGCCTNWSNIIIPNMTYLAFFENRKIWLNLTYLVLSELHRFGSARTHKPRFWPAILSEPQVMFDFLNQSPMIFGTSYVRLMDLQANWFVSVSPLAFCIGVLLSIGASERFGRL